MVKSMLKALVYFKLNLKMELKWHHFEQNPVKTNLFLNLFCQFLGGLHFNSKTPLSYHWSIVLVGVFCLHLPLIRFLFHRDQTATTSTLQTGKSSSKAGFLGSRADVYWTFLLYSSSSLSPLFLCSGVDYTYTSNMMRTTPCLKMFKNHHSAF